jgi:xylose isomerase
MATVNLFYDPVFRDGAFTANDKSVRDYALQKTMRAMDLGAECGAKIFVLWGDAKEWRLMGVAGPTKQ